MDKLQSKEEAQAALRDIERFLEGAPSTLNSGTDVLAMEYEAVITPQLQVGKNNSVSLWVITFIIAFRGSLWKEASRAAHLVHRQQSDGLPETPGFSNEAVQLTFYNVKILAKLGKPNCIISPQIYTLINIFLGSMQSFYQH